MVLYNISQRADFTAKKCQPFAQPNSGGLDVTGCLRHVWGPSLQLPPKIAPRRVDGDREQLNPVSL